MTILIIATILLIVNFVFEYYRHQKNVSMVPIRIHVNGTRGKSSVTRLIASGMRAGNIKTIAKTTGTQPRIILPDGRESSIIRLFSANIIEQKYVFRYAAAIKPQAIVIECMAVNPIFQWITERKFVRSTVSVITNVRSDHLDMMGSTNESIAMCLTNTIPERGVCYTAEEKMFKILKNVAEQRATQIHKIRPVDISAEDLAAFSYIEHDDNIALALAVCEHFGVNRKVALKGMQHANPDPGALTKYTVIEKGKNVTLYNVFAANDPESSLFLWKKITDGLDGTDKIIMLNTRADRLQRSHQLIDIFTDQHYDYFILTGEQTDQLKNYALDHGIKKQKLVVLGEIDPSYVYERVLALTNKEAHIVGVGNIAGARKYGAQIVSYFAKKSKGGM